MSDHEEPSKIKAASKRDALDKSFEPHLFIQDTSEFGVIERGERNYRSSIESKDSFGEIPAAGVISNDGVVTKSMPWRFTLLDKWRDNSAGLVHLPIHFGGRP